LLVTLPLAAGADESRLLRDPGTIDSIWSAARGAPSELVQTKNEQDRSFRAMWRRMGKWLPGNPFDHAPGRCRA
jgi:hypothetical protein